MPDRGDIIELGETGSGDHVQRLAGRIREEVEMQLAHRGPVRAEASGPLWKTMGTALAEAWARRQGQDSPTDRRRTAHSRAHMGKFAAGNCESWGWAARLRGFPRLPRCQAVGKIGASP